MLTTSDLKKLRQIFVTREEFQSFRDESVEYRNENFNRLDAIIFELKAMREELTVLAYQQSTLYDILGDHNLLPKAQ